MRAAEVLKGHLDGLLLSTLEPGPIHGYAVIESLRSRSSGAFDLPTGTVYPALHRLERAGLIHGCWAEGPGRRRRVYQLTAAGQAALTDQRVSWWQFAGAVSTVMGGGGAPAWSPGS